VIMPIYPPMESYPSSVLLEAFLKQYDLLLRVNTSRADHLTFLLQRGSALPRHLAFWQIYGLFATAGRQSSMPTKARFSPRRDNLPVSLASRGLLRVDLTAKSTQMSVHYRSIGAQSGLSSIYQIARYKTRRAYNSTESCVDQTS
jgi:hypothetical protein